MAVSPIVFWKSFRFKANGVATTQNLGFTVPADACVRDVMVNVLAGGTGNLYVGRTDSDGYVLTVGCTSTGVKTLTAAQIGVLLKATVGATNGFVRRIDGAAGGKALKVSFSTATATSMIADVWVEFVTLKEEE